MVRSVRSGSVDPGVLPTQSSAISSSLSLIRERADGGAFPGIVDRDEGGSICDRAQSRRGSWSARQMPLPATIGNSAYRPLAGKAQQRFADKRSGVWLVRAGVEPASVPPPVCLRKIGVVESAVEARK